MTEKRTEIERWDSTEGEPMERFKDGDWVRYDDYRAALEAAEADAKEIADSLQAAASRLWFGGSARSATKHCSPAALSVRLFASAAVTTATSMPTTTITASRLWFGGSARSATRPNIAEWRTDEAV